jgi:hypothetical protein
LGGRLFHFSRPSARRVDTRFIDIVIEIINIQTVNRRHELQDGHNSVSHKVSITDVLALDDYFVNNEVPACSETTVAGENFSGQKRVNVQAAIDYMLRFRYIAVAAPGKTNDARPSKNA